MIDYIVLYTLLPISLIDYAQATPDIVQQTMDDVAALTGRPLGLFDFYGHPQAERVVIAMGSSASVLQEAVGYLNAQGQRVGMINVRGNNASAVTAAAAAASLVLAVLSWVCSSLACMVAASYHLFQNTAAGCCQRVDRQGLS
jgi:pyruvate/2-oxoacid:ferredoxin oxidoreductase alpha subunit